MSIRHSPLPPQSNRHWKFIFRRRLGDHIVTFEWVTWEYYAKGNDRSYVVEWRDKTGQLIHTEFGQHQPEW